jgi:glycine cleavage system aminomethyltransferase T
MFGISPSARLRASPFYAATLREAVTSFTLYNRMLMPTVDLGVPGDTVVIGALRKIATEGPKRQMLGAVTEGGAPMGPALGWRTIAKAGHQVGHLTNGVFWRRLNTNIGFALVTSTLAVGDTVDVTLQDGNRTARLTDLPFL